MGNLHTAPGREVIKKNKKEIHVLARHFRAARRGHFARNFYESSSYFRTFVNLHRSDNPNLVKAKPLGSEFRNRPQLRLNCPRKGARATRALVRLPVASMLIQR